MNFAMIRNGTSKLAIGAAVLLFLLLLVPSVAFADTYSVKVDKGYLALRTAPAYNASNEIGELYTGDIVETVDTTSNSKYWKVESPKYGKTGWVNKNYLIYEGGSSSGQYTVKVDKNYLALRSAPAFMRENEIGQLYTGDKVDYISTYDGTYWWVYSYKYDRNGYVNKNYLTSGSTPAPYGDYSVKVAKNYLALRTAPAFKRENEIGQLYTNDQVDYISTYDGTYWWVYSYKYDCNGYVNKNYLVAN